MPDIYDILKLNKEAIIDFHLQARRVDDYQTGKIINQNLRKLKEIEGRVYSNENIQVSKQSIDEVLYKVLVSAKRNDQNMDNWTVRELRIVSYYMMKLQNEESVYNFALMLLDKKWRNMFFNGLVFFIMNSWNMIKPQLRKNTCDLINKKLLAYEDTNRRYLMYKNHANFFDEAGPARMAALLISKKQDLVTAPNIIGNKPQSFSQSYYSDVIIKYCEKADVGLDRLEQIFTVHPDARTKKLVLADYVIRTDQLHDPIKESELSHFINRILGDVTITATWAPFPGASSEDAAKLKNAMNLAKLWFARRIIETFFEICVQDRERKNFWLQYVKYVSGFKIVGSNMTRQSLQNDPRTSGMFLPHFITTNSKTSQTSALVLSIKNKVMVEFSDTGALYVYNQDHKQVKFLRTGVRTMTSTSDLKIPSMRMLVEENYWGDYNIFNEEGRMTHIGHWRTRLSNWLHTKLLTSSNSEVSFFETKDDKIFVAQELPKEAVIDKPIQRVQPKYVETPKPRTQNHPLLKKEKTPISQAVKASGSVKYETGIRCTVVGKWVFNNSCRVVCNQKGYYLQMAGSPSFAFLRELDKNIIAMGNIWMRSSSKYDWFQIIHVCYGKEYPIGYIRMGVSGVFLFKRDYNQAEFITIKPSRT